jgi:putative methyltransferase (TIGR04325 family)
MNSLFTSIASGAIRSPRLQRVLSPFYRRYFGRAVGRRRLFRGIYPDFAGAMNAIPNNRQIGYNNPTSARHVAYERHFVSPYDYPVLFWLERLLKPGTVIFDWGGNVGISYYAWRGHLTYPSGLTWVINDVPAVLDLGRQIAEQEEAPGLSFTESLDCLGAADILLSAGAMQFVEMPFTTLQSLGPLPRHVLLNKLPVYDQPSAVTLQNIGPAICPYHLFNRAEFIRTFETPGYELIDTWQNPGLGCFVPFYPDHSIGAFTGFYFRSLSAKG